MNRHVACWLLFIGIGSLQLGCDTNDPSATESAAVADETAGSDAAATAKPDDVDAEVDALSDPVLEEIKPADKSAIIRFTQRNRSVVVEGQEFESGVAGIDEAALSPAQTKALAQARSVLASHLELPDAADADLISVTAQQWSDSSLGCGKAGEMAAQVITDGHQVVLVLAGLRHQVHVTTRSGRVCERTQGMLHMPRRSVSRSMLPRLQQRAISSLAQEIGVDPGTITLGKVAVASWPDASMGCAESGIDYAQVPVNGYLLPLHVGGKTITYRTDGRRLTQCDTAAGRVPEIADR